MPSGSCFISNDEKGQAGRPDAATGQTSLRFGDTQASVLLDLLRALAALAVVGEHWRNAFFIDFPQVRQHRLAWAPLYGFTAAGHQAVVIFFVLSGYLISGSIFRALWADRWSWRSYLVHRMVRLWIVVLPGLLVCAACDSLGLSLHRAPQLYAGLSQNHLTSDVLPTRTLPIFFGNLFFIQGIRVPMFGSDGALWSLALEFWYYLLFPLAMLALWRGPARARVLCAGLLVLACSFLGPSVLLSFPLWLFGVLLHAWPAPSLPGWVRWAYAAPYTGLFFYLSRSTAVRGLPADLLLAVATLAFLWLLLSARKRAEPQLWTVRFTRFFARGSFTLYVVHLPMLILLASLLAGDARWMPGTGTVLKAAAAALLTVVLAYLLAMATEFRTDELRRRVESRLGLTS